MLLELGEAANHESVLKVRCNHLLKQNHVVRTELAKALVHYAAKITVSLAAVVLQKQGQVRLKFGNLQ